MPEMPVLPLSLSAYRNAMTQIDPAFIERLLHARSDGLVRHLRHRLSICFVSGTCY